MTVSDLIKSLNAIFVHYGDLDLAVPIDPEGNGYNLLSKDVSVGVVEDGEYYDAEDVEADDEVTHLVLWPK